MTVCSSWPCTRRDVLHQYEDEIANTACAGTYHVTSEALHRASPARQLAQRRSKPGVYYYRRRLT
jgi:hypothetical protein